jgi:hypothetical protein
VTDIFSTGRWINAQEANNSIGTDRMIINASVLITISKLQNRKDCQLSVLILTALYSMREKYSETWPKHVQ